MHHQSERQLLAHVAGPRRQGDAGNGEAQDGFGEPLGPQRGGAPGLLESGRSHCGQERADVLGHAAARGGVQYARVSKRQMLKHPEVCRHHRGMACR